MFCQGQANETTLRTYADRNMPANLQVALVYINGELQNKAEVLPKLAAQEAWLAAARNRLGLVDPPLNPDEALKRLKAMDDEQRGAGVAVMVAFEHEITTVESAVHAVGAELLKEVDPVFAEEALQVGLVSGAVEYKFARNRLFQVDPQQYNLAKLALLGLRSDDPTTQRGSTYDLCELRPVEEYRYEISERLERLKFTPQPDWVFINYKHGALTRWHREQTAAFLRPYTVDPRHRREAMRLLGQMKDKESMLVIVNAYLSGKDDERDAARTALIEAGAINEDYLLSILPQPNQNGRQVSLTTEQKRAATMLERIGTERSMDRLLQLTEISDYRPDFFKLYSLQHFNTPPQPLTTTAPTIPEITGQVRVEVRAPAGEVTWGAGTDRPLHPTIEDVSSISGMVSAPTNAQQLLIPAQHNSAFAGYLFWGRFSLWDLRSGQKVGQTETWLRDTSLFNPFWQTRALSAIVVPSPFGDRLAVGRNHTSIGNHIQIFDLQTGEFTRQLYIPDASGRHFMSYDPIRWLRFAGPDRILTGQAMKLDSDSPYTVRVWSISTGELLRELVYPGSTINAALSPGGTYVAFLHGEVVVVHRVQDGALVGRLPTEVPRESAKLLEFSPDGKYLSLHGTEITEVWNTANGEVVDRHIIKIADRQGIRWLPASDGWLTGRIGDHDLIEIETGKLVDLKSGEMRTDLAEARLHLRLGELDYCGLCGVISQTHVLAEFEDEIHRTGGPRRIEAVPIAPLDK